MKEHGFSIRGLAKLLGVAKSTVQKWRRAQHPLTPYSHFCLKNLVTALTYRVEKQVLLDILQYQRLPDPVKLAESCETPPKVVAKALQNLVNEGVLRASTKTIKPQPKRETHIGA
jgi:DNA-binding transcriptional regulator YhcF (GntR family)